VVNCASTFEQDTPSTFSFEAMEKHMRSNAGAAILLSQALHTHISKRRTTEPNLTGVVVNLLDQKIWNKSPDLVSYTLSKAALDAANTLLAVALQPLVRVVGVAPEVAARGPMLRGEKLAERGQSGESADDAPDATAAVLLALQDANLTATTLLVEDGPLLAVPLGGAASQKGSNV
jgi:NAD(P)-dependent dehydrogenase (short-subunit alcohol dehydrogenase family)